MVIIVSIVQVNLTVDIVDINFASNFVFRLNIEIQVEQLNSSRINKYENNCCNMAFLAPTLNSIVIILKILE